MLDAALPTLDERLRLQLRLSDLFLANVEELLFRERERRRLRPEVPRACEATEASELLEPDNERSWRGDRDT